MKQFLLFIGLFFTSMSYGQVQQSSSSTEIYNELQDLNFLGTVLYVAAHPDDENTTLISYFSNEVHARVGYVSLTRGDGGQNLIGPELRELLGVIRTEELLAARRVDGGNQFFSRANDFGYSKNPKETFATWNKENVLNDLVYVIRKFQPDIIINRFDHRTPGTTHGHHTGSAMLSVEAFDKAGDSAFFPSQLKTVNTWQPKRLFFNTNWWFYGSKEKFIKIDKSDLFTINVGNYYPMSGYSNTEIAALSRSQHKSQGFGVAGKRGNDIEYFELLKGDFDVESSSMFNGINTTWSRVEGGEEIGQILIKVQNDFDFKNPEASLPQLLIAYQKIKELDNDYWRTIKLKQIKKIIVACAGLYMQPSTTTQFATKGTTVQLTIEAINRSNATIMLNNITISPLDVSYSFKQNLINNVDFTVKKEITLTDQLEYTSPYWLKKPHTIGMYTVNDQNKIGLPQNIPQLQAHFNLTINGVPITLERELVYKTTTPVKGEVRKPFAVVPKIAVEMNTNTLLFPDTTSRKIKVIVNAYEDNVTGILRLSHPKNWKVYPEQVEINLTLKGSRELVEFTITPPDEQSKVKLIPEFTSDGEVYTKQLYVIDYPHIRTQTVLLPASTNAIQLEIEKAGDNIGYIKGAGDAIPSCLREIGYKVTLIDAKKMKSSQLKKYDAIVIGIRAYDTNEDLIINQPILFDYIQQGGTVVTQYNTTRELKTEKVAPYTLKLSHNRVTEEDSEVEFLDPNHPVLNIPNNITKEDFKGWVQERGLYFPEKWSAKYTEILGMHDEGEKQLKSSLLVAKYGKGYFVYTGLSFFRELPAGVAGAYRLFANILSLGN